MSVEFITRAEFNSTVKGIEDNLGRVTRSVDKMVDKVDNLGHKIDDTGRTVAMHDVSLQGFEKTVDKLSAVVDKWADTVVKVDKETALNTNNIQWNWKSITAAGFVITVLFTAIATAISNIFTG